MDMEALGSFDPSLIQSFRNQAFNSADSDSSGGLDVSEFSSLMEEMMAGGAGPVNGAGKSAEAVFSDIDSDSDGSLSQEEMDAHHQEMMASLSPSAAGSTVSATSMTALLQAQMDELFSSADADGSGGLNEEEFSSFNSSMQEAGMPPPPDGMGEAEVFSAMDLDGDGEVSAAEMEAYAEENNIASADMLRARMMDSLLSLQEAA